MCAAADDTLHCARFARRQLSDRVRALYHSPVPSWSKTEALGETVAATAQSGGSEPIKRVRTHEHTPQSMGDTAYAMKRPAIDPGVVAIDDPLIGTQVDHFEL